jgi:hypothetical protein
LCADLLELVLKRTLAHNVAVLVWTAMVLVWMAMVLVWTAMVLVWTAMVLVWMGALATMSRSFVWQVMAELAPW